MQVERFKYFLKHRLCRLENALRRILFSAFTRQLKHGRNPLLISPAPRTLRDGLQLDEGDRRTQRSELSGDPLKLFRIFLTTRRIVLIGSQLYQGVRLLKCTVSTEAYSTSLDSQQL